MSVDKADLSVIIKVNQRKYMHCSLVNNPSSSTMPSFGRKAWIIGDKHGYQRKPSWLIVEKQKHRLLATNLVKNVGYK